MPVKFYKSYLFRGLALCYLLFAAVLLLLGAYLNYELDSYIIKFYLDNAELNINTNKTFLERKLNFSAELIDDFINDSAVKTSLAALPQMSDEAKAALTDEIMNMKAASPDLERIIVIQDNGNIVFPSFEADNIYKIYPSLKLSPDPRKYHFEEGRFVYVKRLYLESTGGYVVGEISLKPYRDIFGLIDFSLTDASGRVVLSKNPPSSRVTIPAKNMFVKTGSGYVYYTELFNSLLRLQVKVDKTHFTGKYIPVWLKIISALLTGTVLYIAAAFAAFRFMRKKTGEMIGFIDSAPESGGDPQRALPGGEFAVLLIRLKEALSRDRQDVSAAQDRQKEAEKRDMASENAVKTLKDTIKALAALIKGAYGSENELYRAVCDTAAAVQKADAAYVMKMKGDDTLEVMHYKGSNKFFSGTSLIPGSLAEGEALASGKTVYKGDAGGASSYMNFAEGVFKACCTAPVCLKAGIWGTISVCWKEPPPRGQVDTDVMTLAAGQAASYLELKAVEKELLEYSEELNRALDEAGKALSTKDGFFKKISHELRTPLSAVIGFTQVLKDGAAGQSAAERREYIDIIHRNSTAMLDLIGSLLDMARLDSREAAANISEVDLPSLLESSLILVREQAIELGIRLTEKIDSSCGIILTGERELKAVMFSLLSNAVKYTPAGGEVVLEAARIGKAVAITVRDTGTGIKPEDMPDIFERTGRDSGGGPGKNKGTGYSLSIAKKLVELLGGEITAESKPGEGSSFRVLLHTDGGGQVD